MHTLLQNAFTKNIKKLDFLNVKHTLYYIVGGDI